MEICCEYFISPNTSILTEEPAEKYYITDSSPESEGQSKTHEIAKDRFTHTNTWTPSILLNIWNIRCAFWRLRIIHPEAQFVNQFLWCQACHSNDVEIDNSQLATPRVPACDRSSDQTYDINRRSELIVSLNTEWRPTVDS